MSVRHRYHRHCRAGDLGRRDAGWGVLEHKAVRDPLPKAVDREQAAVGSGLAAADILGCHQHGQPGGGAGAGLAGAARRRRWRSDGCSRSGLRLASPSHTSERVAQPDEDLVGGDVVDVAGVDAGDAGGEVGAF